MRQCPGFVPIVQRKSAPSPLCVKRSKKLLELSVGFLFTPGHAQPDPAVRTLRLLASRPWKQTELRHHRKAIRNAPVFDNLAVFKATNIHDRNGDRLAGRRPDEGATIGAASRHAYPDGIGVRDALLNRQMQIWESRTQILNVLFESFQGGLRPELVFPVTGCEERIQGRIIALVEPLFNDATKYVLVLFS